MILPTTASAVWILAVVSLLCLGSWANSLKLAGKWRFEYFYYDFVFGIVLCAGVAALVFYCDVGRREMGVTGNSRLC